MKMTRYIYFAAAAAALCLAAASCTEQLELPVPSDGAVAFSLHDEGFVTGPRTKTVLSAPDIETKKTSVTLAAYRAGTLYRSGYFTSDLSQMELELVSGETYNVYAFVNMGDRTASLPASESGLSGVTYTIPAWQSVNNSGLPMTGVLTGFTAAPGTPGTVPVTRRFAKVTASLTCTWPGARITGAVVGNMNARIPLVGYAAMSGVSDALSWEDSDTGGSSSATMVFYVPENMQGTVSGISRSHDKSHEFNATVAANRDKLTYLEVSASGSSSSSAMYGGNVTYRSYLGDNATTNFDIEGNTAYVWTITYGEDGLAEDTWKIDTEDLDDRRTFSWNQNPIYVEPGQTVTFSNWYTTNITTGIGVELSGPDLNEVVASSTGTAFTVSSDSRPAIGVTATATPAHNPIQRLIQSTLFVVRRWVAEWKGYSQQIFSDEGKKVYVIDYHGGFNGSKTVAPTVDYWNNPGGNPNSNRGVGEQAPGSGNAGMKWTYSRPSGMSVQYSGSLDRVTYTVPKTVVPGDYPIYATVKADGYADEAFIRVLDTRFLYWSDGADLSVSEEYTMGTLLTLPAGGSAPSFVFGDETGNTGSPLSGGSFYPNGYNYPYLYGQGIASSFLQEIQSSLVVDVPSTLTFSSGPTLVTGMAQGVAVGRLSGTLASLPSPGTHTITVYLADDPSLSIDLDLVFTSAPVESFIETLEISPATANILVGNTHAFTVTLVTQRCENGVPVGNPTRQTLSNSAAGMSWQSSNPSKATVSAGNVTGVSVGQTVITVSYNAPHGGHPQAQATINVIEENGMDVETDWNEGGEIELEP